MRRVEERLKAVGLSAQAASTQAGLSKDAIRNMQRAIQQKGRAGVSTKTITALAPVLETSVAWLLNEEGDESIQQSDHRRSVKVVGYLGAGAEVEPDFEQVPPEGLEQVDLPFELPDDMIAFIVRGDSMLPALKDGHLMIVYREQKKPLESFYGEEAAVRTSDGRRFIKTIMRGTNGVNLFSWNAPPIENVQLDWIGEIFAAIPAGAIRRTVKQGGIQGQLRLRA
ncbi:XRE family transcriptional regulator [Phyllobacterium ifriqiyense]|uniref:XRE family transcriptional regulator n=1 Tax=Phyllobacterium ifriqiyense TaxID=314238 RepID=UPI0027D7A419|nr:LexA family transcriptional regulator [Phyllobacterium ifriqiyense]